LGQKIRDISNKKKKHFKQKEETNGSKKNVRNQRQRAAAKECVYFFIKKVRARLHISKKSCNFAPYFG